MRNNLHEGYSGDFLDTVYNKVQNMATAYRLLKPSSEYSWSQYKRAWNKVWNSYMSGPERESEPDVLARDLFSRLQQIYKQGLNESYDPDQLAIGTEIEFEHTDSKEKAEQIAKDHLDEFPDYYSRLAKMERKAKEDHEPEEKELDDLEEKYDTSDVYDYMKGDRSDPPVEDDIFGDNDYIGKWATKDPDLEFTGPDTLEYIATVDSRYPEYSDIIFYDHAAGEYVIHNRQYGASRSGQLNDLSSQNKAVVQRFGKVFEGAQYQVIKPYYDESAGELMGQTFDGEDRGGSVSLDIGDGGEPLMIDKESVRQVESTIREFTSAEFYIDPTGKQKTLKVTLNGVDFTFPQFIDRVKQKDSEALRIFNQTKYLMVKNGKNPNDLKQMIQFLGEYFGVKDQKMDMAVRTGVEQLQYADEHEAHFKKGEDIYTTNPEKAGMKEKDIKRMFKPGDFIVQKYRRGDKKVVYRIDSIDYEDGEAVLLSDQKRKLLGASSWEDYDIERTIAGAFRKANQDEVAMARKAAATKLRKEESTSWDSLEKLVEDLEERETSFTESEHEISVEHILEVYEELMEEEDFAEDEIFDILAENFSLTLEELQHIIHHS